MTDFKLLYDARITDEKELVHSLHQQVAFNHEDHKRHQLQAKLLSEAHQSHDNASTLAMISEHFAADNPNGPLLLALAESLLRIPDNKTAKMLLKDVLSRMDFTQKKARNWMESSLSYLQKLTQFSSTATALTAPISLKASREIIAKLGEHFILGQTAQEALGNSQTPIEQGFLFSYDMLGEGARSHAQAGTYMTHYLAMIEQLSQQEKGSLKERPSLSVKLSALSPCYELMHYERLERELLPRLETLIKRATEANIMLVFDAEEIRRHDLMLTLFERCYHSEVAEKFDGLGLAVQAYHKGAYATCQWLKSLAETKGRPIAIRLVKGAYWDTEIKAAQQAGLQDYPVFTRKYHSDISYLACARYLFEHKALFYPQFATHNPLTIAEIMDMATHEHYEFQLLKGMGEGIYHGLTREKNCRIYAPVGSHQELLPYLIRRLLENSASSSFLASLADDNTPLKNPLLLAEDHGFAPHSDMPLIADIYPHAHAQGLDFHSRFLWEKTTDALEPFYKKQWHGSALVGGTSFTGETHIIHTNPPLDKPLGQMQIASYDVLKSAYQLTYDAFESWSQTPWEERIATIKMLATLLEEHQLELIALLQLEAGKTRQDALDEWRETVDFCHYYAQQAERLMPESLASATGESNYFSYHGRGVVICISPWNFPLAIFAGQIIAALITGNSVLAKPASHTMLIAHRMAQLFYQAGIPDDVLSFVPCNANDMSQLISQAPSLGGIAFTGSFATAKILQETLTKRPGPFVPLLAETGGINAMIIDSTALLEHACDAIITSAFNSAGQRCSALRMVYVQEEIYAPLKELLSEAMEALVICSPLQEEADIGPIISSTAGEKIMVHCKRYQKEGKIVATSPAPEEQAKNYVVPHLVEVDSISDIPEEIFGPVLHIASFKSAEFDRVVTEIHTSHFGLTMGIQTRIQSRIDTLKNTAKIGNLYVNRPMIGAIPGVQPFGGEGFSGTGPKAGGPNYLKRFCVERHCSVDDTAVGGNIGLLSLE